MNQFEPNFQAFATDLQTQHRILQLNRVEDGKAVTYPIRLVMLEQAVVSVLIAINVQDFLRYMGWKDSWPEIKSGIEGKMHPQFHQSQRYYNMVDLLCVSLEWIAWDVYDVAAANVSLRLLHETVENAAVKFARENLRLRLAKVRQPLAAQMLEELTDQLTPKLSPVELGGADLT